MKKTKAIAVGDTVTVGTAGRIGVVKAITNTPWMSNGGVSMATVEWQSEFGLTTDRRTVTTLTTTKETS